MSNFGILLQVWGDYALFSRPEMKVERVSYDVITPSAARGVLEAIYWKPEIRWIVDRMCVLNPIRTTPIRRNEVQSKISTGSVASAMKSGRGSLGLMIEDDRQQRASIVLKDVAYLIAAHFEIVSADANPAKHLDQFNRRARAGKCFHRPYLGTREFPCDFALVEGDVPSPAPEIAQREQHDLGYMLNDLDYVPDPKGSIVESSKGTRVRAEPRFFRAVMQRGWIEVPPLRKEPRS